MQQTPVSPNFRGHVDRFLDHGSADCQPCSRASSIPPSSSTTVPSYCAGIERRRSKARSFGQAFS